MRAAILTHYDKKGTDLEIQDIPVPVPEDDEILVRIMAAAVNPLDNMIIRGEVKLIVPYQMPLIMGNEFAGVVEKTGRNTAGFRPGDRVYGRMSPGKRILFQIAGRKYDKMAAAKNQTYDFIFVHEDEHQLEKIASLFDKDHPLETSIDTVFSLEKVNEALDKVKRGGSKGKTIIQVHAHVTE